MFIAKDICGNEICTRCGKYAVLTKDHFIPKSSRMSVNEKQHEALYGYMRYARSFIRKHCSDIEILQVIEQI